MTLLTVQDVAMSHDGANVFAGVNFALAPNDRLAILARPQLLLLDEPFSSLDPLLREELIADVLRLAGEINAALVLVTHDVFEALTLAHRALVLESGSAVEAGELLTLLASPRSRLLRRFSAQIETACVHWRTR